MVLWSALRLGHRSQASLSHQYNERLVQLVSNTLILTKVYDIAFTLHKTMFQHGNVLSEGSNS